MDYMNSKKLERSNCAMSGAISIRVKDRLL